MGSWTLTVQRWSAAGNLKSQRSQNRADSFPPKPHIMQIRMNQIVLCKVWKYNNVIMTINIIKQTTSLLTLSKRHRWLSKTALHCHRVDLHHEVTEEEKRNILDPKVCCLHELQALETFFFFFSRFTFQKKPPASLALYDNTTLTCAVE